MTNTNNVRNAQTQLQRLEEVLKSKGYTLSKPVTYEGTKTRVHVQCPHDHQWNASFNNIVHCGSGCPECSYKKRVVNMTSRTRLSQEEAEAKVQKVCEEKGYELCKPFEYKNQNTRVALKCTKDGHEWDVSTNNLVKMGRGCPMCALHNMYKKKPTVM